MSLYDPRNRKEIFYKGILDADQSLPDPQTREEIYLKAIAEAMPIIVSDTQVVQSTGSSAYDVMSQKAATDAFALQTDFDQIASASTNLFDKTEARDNTAMSTAAGIASSNVTYWITGFMLVTGLSKVISSIDGSFIPAYIGCFYSAANESSFISTQFSSDSYDVPVNANYVRLQFRNSLNIDKSKLMINGGSVILPFEPFGLVVDNVKNGSITNTKLVDGSITFSKLYNGQYPYFGERINLVKNGLDAASAYPYTASAPSGSPQSGVIAGDQYLFVIGSAGSVRPYDITTSPWTKLTDFDLGDLSTLAPHCNSAFFGLEKYDNGDDYPILFVNAYNAPGLPLGTLYGYRVVKTTVNDAPVFTATLVQTITVGFTDNAIWTDGNDIRPYGNFVLDTDNNVLYAYTLRDADQVTRFFGFNMPALSGGDKTFTTANIITQFDVPYFPVIQDNAYINGMVFIGSGLANAGHIRVVSLLSQSYTNDIYNPTFGDNKEPELVIYHNGKILEGNGLMYWLTF